MFNVYVSKPQKEKYGYIVELRLDWNGNDNLRAFTKLTSILQKIGDIDPRTWSRNANNVGHKMITLGSDPFEAKMQYEVLIGDLEAADFNIIYPLERQGPKTSHPYR